MIVSCITKSGENSGSEPRQRGGGLFSWNGVYSSQTLQQCRIRPTGKGSRRKSRWEAMDGGKNGACVGKLGLQCGVEENMLGKRARARL